MMVNKLASYGIITLMKTHMEYRPHLGFRTFSMLLKMINFKNGYLAKRAFNKGNGMLKMQPPQIPFSGLRLPAAND